MVSGFEFDLHGKQVQTESLEGIERVRLDCDDLDLRLEADAGLSGAAQLITSGTDHPPILKREGFDLVIKQNGHYRPADRDPAILRLPPTCPPISGRHERGDLTAQRLSTALTVRRGGGGHVLVEGGDGPLTFELGKGDAFYRDRSGPIAHRSGSGDVQFDRCEGPLSVSLGKGDVHARNCESVLLIKNGSGDVQTVDCAGELIVKNGSGDVIVTRPREQRVSVNNGNGDVNVEDGSLLGMAVRTARGNVTCNAQLLLPGGVFDEEQQWASFSDLDPDSQSIEQVIARAVQDAMAHSRAAESLSRAVEDAMARFNAQDALRKFGEFEFEAGDDGVRISRGGRPVFEASDQGVRFAKGSFAFEASDAGVRIKRSSVAGEAGVRPGEFDIETSGGDISIQAPVGVPIRVEVLVNSGDVRSDIPLVSVGRPGPRGSTQRLVGGTNPGDGERLNLRLRTDRGDVRLRAVRPAPQAPYAPYAPSAPPTPPTPPTPATPPTPLVTPANEREERMQTILNAVASGSLSIAEAEKLLEALDKGA